MKGKSKNQNLVSGTTSILRLYNPDQVRALCSNLKRALSPQMTPAPRWRLVADDNGAEEMAGRNRYRDERLMAVLTHS